MKLYSVGEIAEALKKSRQSVLNFAKRYEVGSPCGNTFFFTEEMKIIMLAAPMGRFSYTTAKKLMKCEKPNLYNVDEMAEFSGLTKPRVYQLVEEMKIGSKVEGRLIFTEKDKDQLEERYASS